MQKMCPPGESAVKCFFLGPKAENSEALKNEVFYALERWFRWRKEKFPGDGPAIPELEQNSNEYRTQQQFFHRQIETVLTRFEQEIPKFSPRYFGHMFSEFSLPALMGHLITLLHNPNNVSRESSRVGVEFEREAIGFLCEFLDYPQTAVGHFTSGGTLANLEFLLRAKHRWLTWLGNCWNNSSLNFVQASNAGWETGSATGIDLHDLSDIAVARKIQARYQIDFLGPVLLVPETKHYSWIKGCNYFGLGKEGMVTVALDSLGCLDVTDLQQKIRECLLQNRPILGVVSVCGTTELGTIDAIDDVNEVLASFRADGLHIWHHVDAAYGGFFATLKNLDPVALSPKQIINLRALKDVDSITLDPHKLGYVPYASGAFLCKEPRDYFIHLFKAPYVQFDPTSDRGLFTIEGTRSAAGAVSTWLTGACIGFHADGYGKILNRTIQNCHHFEKALKLSGLPVLFLGVPGTNILCFALGQKGDSLAKVNQVTTDVLHRLNESKPETDTFFVSTTTLKDNFSSLISRVVQEYELRPDAGELVVLRLTIMNPFLLSKHNNVNYMQDFIGQLKQILASSP